MLTLSLYDSSTPPKLIEKRTIGSRLVRFGRDPESDWVVEDPDRLTSRHHLDLRAVGSSLMVRARSKHDVYTGTPPRKVSKESETEIKVGESLSVGIMRLIVEDSSSDEPVVEADVTSGKCHPPADHTLFRAFCDGAGIDPSHFIADDPASVLREAGAVYREAVVGLSKLLRSRSEVRAGILADRTMIESAENNLLKWAPSHRIVADLLADKQEGFLAGARAFHQAFEDVGTHLNGLIAGHRSALEMLLESLRPSVLESGAPRGFLRHSAAEAWERYKLTYDSLMRSLHDSDCGLGDGFADGYEHSVQRKRA